MIPPDQFQERNVLLNELLEKQGRQPDAVRRSIMHGSVYGQDEAQLQRNAAFFDRSLEELKEFGMFVGPASEIVEQLGAYAEAGAQRVMVQWLGLDDLDLLEDFATRVLPQVQP